MKTWRKLYYRETEWMIAMKESFRILKDKLFPLLFSVSLTYWTMCSFFGEPLIETLFVAIVLHSLLFMVFSTTAGKGVLRKILVLLFSFIYFFGVFIIISISSNSYARSYYIWTIVTKADNIDFVPGYWLGTLLLAAFGFSFTVFYFTLIRFRIGIIFMISIIPFLIHTAKTDKEITFPFIVFIILFFTMYVEKSWRKSPSMAMGRSYSTDKWYIAAVFIFILLALSLSMSIPKPNSIPKLAYIDAVIGQTIQPLANAALNNNPVQNYSQVFNPMVLRSRNKLDSVSGPLGQRILFEVEARESLYFRVQSWDKYIRNQWIVGEKSLTNGYPVDSFYKRQIQLGVITSLISGMKEEELSELGLSDLSNSLKMPSIPQRLSRCSIYTKRTFMESFLNPPGIFGFDRLGVLMNEAGSCYPDKGKLPGANDQYAMEYVSSGLNASSKEFRIISQMNKGVFSKLYNYANNKGPDLPDPDALSVLLEAEREMSLAYSNYTDLPQDMPGRIYDLAESITAGKTSDYSKALAIEQFFHTGNFTYDLSPGNLPKNEDFNDYFIFESKNGLCVHFASSMVILARACGLPARYVEGYVADEIDRKTGRYLIREKDAHAFPEVYIAGFGWRVFEPTAAIGRENDGIFVLLEGFVSGVKKIVLASVDFLNAMPLWAKILLIPMSAFAFSFMAWIYIRIRNELWEKRVMRTDRSRALEEIFKRVESQLKNIKLDIKKWETPANYAERILNESGVSIHALTDSFNKAKYGGFKPSVEDMEIAVGVYKQVVLEVKKRVGKPKAWIIG